MTPAGNWWRNHCTAKSWDCKFCRSDCAVNSLSWAWAAWWSLALEPGFGAMPTKCPKEELTNGRWCTQPHFEHSASDFPSGIENKPVIGAEENPVLLHALLMVFKGKEQRCQGLQKEWQCTCLYNWCFSQKKKIIILNSVIWVKHQLSCSSHWKPV